MCGFRGWRRLLCRGWREKRRWGGATPFEEEGAGKEEGAGEKEDAGGDPQKFGLVDVALVGFSGMYEERDLATVGEAAVI